MKSELICWDSSVLVSWIRKEASPDRTTKIKRVVRSLEDGSFMLAMSVLVYPEILETNKKMTKDAITKFEDFLKNRERVNMIAVDTRVAKKAQEIRNLTNMKTPDAIHVATAIISRAKKFHTFDKGILKFNGKDEVENLAITACIIPGLAPAPGLFD